MSIREFHAVLNSRSDDHPAAVIAALQRLREADPSVAISAVEDEPLWPIWTCHTED